MVSIASSQYQMSHPDSNAPTQASVKIPYPAAPLHYVQIGPQLTGDYKFGYDTGKGPLGQSFREEIRLADGTISGKLSYKDIYLPNYYYYFKFVERKFYCGLLHRKLKDIHKKNYSPDC